MKEKYSEAGRNPYDGLRLYSALTHGVGIAFALMALGVLLHMTVKMSAVTITAVSVYAVSMLCLYTASTVNNPYFGCHEIFHVFIVLGSICHFIMIYQMVC